MHAVVTFVVLAFSFTAFAAEDPSSDVKSIAVPVTASVKVADAAAPNDAPEASSAATFQVSNDIQQRVSRQLAQNAQQVAPPPAPPAAVARLNVVAQHSPSSSPSAAVVQNSPQGGTLTVPPPPFEGALNPPQLANPEQAPGIPRFYFRIGQPDVAPQILIGNPPIPPPLFTVLGNGSSGHTGAFLFNQANAAAGQPARVVHQNAPLPAGLGIAPHQVQQKPANGARSVSGAGVGTGGSFLVGSPNGARALVGTAERGVALVGSSGGPTQAVTYGAGTPQAAYAPPASTAPIHVPGQVAQQPHVYAHPPLPAQPQYSVPQYSVPQYSVPQYSVPQYSVPQYSVPAQPSVYQQPVYYQQPQPVVVSQPGHYSPYTAPVPHGQVSYVPSPYYG